ncbi:MAG: DUF2934 domain-containing protein [Candidatus Acidiferrales bacterium]
MIERKGLSKEDIAHRAYELFVQRDGAPGNDIEDWVKAEKELTGESLAAPPKATVASAGRY